MKNNQETYYDISAYIAVVVVTIYYFFLPREYIYWFKWIVLACFLIYIFFFVNYVRNRKRLKGIIFAKPIRVIFNIFMSYFAFMCVYPLFFGNNFPTALGYLYWLLLGAFIFSQVMKYYIRGKTKE